MRPIQARRRKDSVYCIRKVQLTPYLEAVRRRVAKNADNPRFFAGRARVSLISARSLTRSTISRANSDGAVERLAIMIKDIED